MQVKIVLPASTALPKKNLIRSYGATIVEIDGSTDDAIEKRDEIAQSDPEKYFVPNQFGNYANMRAHYNLTGPYLLEKMKEIDYLVV